jgi:hypothetical protein
MLRYVVIHPQYQKVETRCDASYYNTPQHQEAGNFAELTGSRVLVIGTSELIGAPLRTFGVMATRCCASKISTPARAPRGAVSILPWSEEIRQVTRSINYAILSYNPDV